MNNGVPKVICKNCGKETTKAIHIHICRHCNRDYRKEEKMKNSDKLMRILSESKSYEFIDSTKLKITAYHSGDSITLDLQDLVYQEEILDEMVVEDEEE